MTLAGGLYDPLRVPCTSQTQNQKCRHTSNNGGQRHTKIQTVWIKLPPKLPNKLKPQIDYTISLLGRSNALPHNQRVVSIGVGIVISKSFQFVIKSIYFCANSLYTIVVRMTRLRMRILITLLLLSICAILMVGIYIRLPQLFGDTTTVISAPITPANDTPINNPIVDLQSVKSTQTAIVNQTTTTALPRPAATVINVIAPAPPAIVTPARLPITGSADGSDIWNNTAIIGLIGGCIVLSVGLYWQSRRIL